MSESVLSPTSGGAFDLVANESAHTSIEARSDAADAADTSVDGIVFDTGTAEGTGVPGDSTNLSFLDLDANGGILSSGVDLNDLELDPIEYETPDHLAADYFTSVDGTELGFSRFDEDAFMFDAIADSETKVPEKVPPAFDLADSATIGFSPLELGDTSTVGVDALKLSDIDAEGGFLSELKSDAAGFLSGAVDFAVDTGRAFLHGAVIEPFTNMRLGHQNTLEGFGFISEEEQGARAATITRDLDEAGEDIGAIARVLGGLPGSVIGQIVETLAVSNVDLAASEIAAELHEGTIEEDDAFWRLQAKTNGAFLNDVALLIGFTPGARAAVASVVTGGSSAFIDKFGTADPDIDVAELVFKATRAGATSIVLDTAFAGIDARAKPMGSTTPDPEGGIPTQALLDGSLAPDEVQRYLGVNGQKYLDWAKNWYTDPEKLNHQIENMAGVIDNYRSSGSAAGSTEILLDERADFMREALAERGILTSPLAVPAANQPVIFRTDTRLPDEIFAKGFEVRDLESTKFVGDEHEAALYTLMNRGYSAFPISFSESGSGVLSYLKTDGGGKKAYDGSIVYIVENSDPGNMNISETMKRSPNSRVGYTPYNEVIVQNANGGPADKVKGAIKFSVDGDGKVTTRYIENSTYAGESPLSKAELRRRQESGEL